MSKILKLYNTFTKSLNAVELSGKLIGPTNNGQLINGSFYICGPTVYSDSHLGHALTYIRADLFRRFMKSIFNVRLHTVMNITDIDDKILDKTRKEFGDTDNKFSSEPSSHPFNKVSEKYYKSFLSDLESIKVSPADLYVKVSEHIHLITAFIRKLERDGHAYIASNGDVHFKVNSIKNYIGRTDSRKDNSDKMFKNDVRDFVLWKVAKPNEPVWLYHSSVHDKCIPGRPGWHVQCSAISSSLFGNKLDFHFGGKDLIFPHHYNEEACCCAYHTLDTSRSLHVWSNNWLHSGHLILRDTKMSKSLGNVIEIKNFIDRSSVNALRLLCVYSHYRSDLEFSEDLLDKLKAIDHKISAFSSYLSEELKNTQESLHQVDMENEVVANSDEIERAVSTTHDDIINGVCDDFHLDKGLDSILNLSKLMYVKGVKNLKPRDIIVSWSLLKDWCDTCGLDYGHTTNSSSYDESILKLLSEFRNRVRAVTLSELKSRQSADQRDNNSLHELLKECDSVRARIDQLGFVFRDSKS